MCCCAKETSPEAADQGPDQFLHRLSEGPKVEKASQKIFGETVDETTFWQEYHDKSYNASYGDGWDFGGDFHWEESWPANDGLGESGETRLQDLSLLQGP